MHKDRLTQTDFGSAALRERSESAQRLDMDTLATKTSVKVVGSNGQISLGKEFAGRQVLVEEQEPGVWLVRTAMVIPENELWLHQPQARAELERALDWAQRNPPKESDPDAILKRLKDGGRTAGKKGSARSER